MQHRIAIKSLEPFGEPMADAIQKCVHCGFCLPTCPTYATLGEEMDSPRGRIFLMKEVLEDRLPLDQVVPYIDRCLGCVACETSCPSGVPYGELITPFRAEAEQRRKRSATDRGLRWFVLNTLPYPARMRWAIRTGSLARLFRAILPARMRTMIDLLPDRVGEDVDRAEFAAATGTRRARVALLRGCAQSVLAPEIHAATVRVLVRNGVEVMTPAAQVCCGALAAHTGDMRRAQQFARANLAAFPNDVDAIITNAAGCGSGMHEYPLWLRGTPQQGEAREFADRVVDVSKFLADLGIETPPEYAQPLRIAYHDACHLAHAQRISQEPRRLLKSIPNVTLLPIAEAELCCGSAGTYNIEQPDVAGQLGRRKADAIRETQPDMVATGNIGCMMQLRSQFNGSLPVVHTMQVLDACYRGQSLASHRES